MRKKLPALLLLLLILPLALTACGDDDDEPEINLTTAALAPDSPAGRGAKVFQTYCATCHAVIGDRRIVGPPLTHIATTAAGRLPNTGAEDYIRESILDPDAYLVEGFAEGSMQQNFATQLTSEQLNDVVVYLLVLQ